MVMAPVECSDPEIVRMLTALREDSGMSLNEKSKYLAELTMRTHSLFYAFGVGLHVNGKPFINGAPSMVTDMFNVEVPRIRVMKCGRQIGKSTTLSAMLAAYSSVIPYFNSLFVTPQFEMTRRFSSNYCGPMIEHSPLTPLILDRGCDRNVLQRSFRNGAIIHFSYAGDTADRVRGIPASQVIVDEGQDISRDNIDELYQTTGRSEYRMLTVSGTPKTFDNTEEYYWARSSMNEWVIPCHNAGCRYENIPTINHDALKMIGDDTLICAKCGRPIDSMRGFWVAGRPSRLNESVGWHIPQIILPFHYQNPSNWGIIARAARGEISPHLFYNEILGESYDIGAKMVTQEELMAACTIDKDIDWNRSKKGISKYTIRVLGCDWGGRGTDDLSRTKIAVIGMTPDGHVEVIYAEDLSRLPGPDHESVRVVQIARHFGCAYIAHDTSGTAGTRDVLLHAAGWPTSQLMPLAYTSPWAASLIIPHQATDNSNRFFYAVNKARALALICAHIKFGVIRFPRWESIEPYAMDFLALIEEQTYNKRGGDTYLINRASELSDDWVHALTLACLATYHQTDYWPKLDKTLAKRVGDLKGDPEADNIVVVS